MAQYHGDGMDYVADDNEMAEVEDDMYFRGRALGETDSDDDDDDEYDPLENRITDTTAAEARRGKDIQGIPWDRLSISREKYRQTRLEQYKNYENIPQSGELSEKECKVTQKGGLYYDFWQNTRSVKSTILHFQLRNLVWSTSKHDVYLVAHYSIVHWSSLSSKRSEVLNVSGHVAPCEKHPGSLLEGFTQTQISTLAVRDNLLIAGGFQGELICKYLDRPGVSFCSRTTYEDNAITNAVEIYEHPSGAVHFMASNNDGGIRDFDMETFQLTKHSCFPWPVNALSLVPDLSKVEFPSLYSLRSLKVSYWYYAHPCYKEIVNFLLQNAPSAKVDIKDTTEIPAGEDINIEGRKKCHENDLIKSQMESNDESLTEKRIRVATYEEEQSNLAGQIQFHEQELQRLHARDHELAEKIKADKECILSQEGLRKKFSDDLAVCARSIRELSDKQYQQRWKTRSDLQHLIRLLQDD